MRRPDVVIGLALVAASAFIGGNALALPTAQDGGPRVVDERAVDLEDGRIRALSPDGRRLLVERGKRICVYDAGTLAEPTCVAWPGEQLDFTSFVWSPDGERVTFTEDAYRFFVDGDVWVMEAATGRLTNLTDDGVNGGLTFEEDVPQRIDTVPAWSPDGTELVFARGTMEGIGLYRIAADGGDPSLMHEISPEEAGAVFVTGLSWSAEGSAVGTVFYSLLVLDDDAVGSPEDGVWRIDADGGTAHLLLGTDPDQPDEPTLLEVSVRGDVLVTYPRAAARLEPPFIALLPAGDDMPIPLFTTTSGTPAGTTEAVLGAAFSPDGGQLLLASIALPGSVDTGRLTVRDLTTGEEVVLRDGFGGVGLGPGQGLDWAADGTVYAAVSPFNGVLLELEGLPAATPAATGTAATPAGPVPADGIEVGATVVVNDATVSMRTAPSTEAPVALELAQGAELEVIGPVEEGDGFVWVPVRDLATRIIGYVRSEFLST